MEIKEFGWVLVFKAISFDSRMQHDITNYLNFTKLLVQGPLELLKDYEQKQFC
jgi:hypothetical protein